MQSYAAPNGAHSAPGESTWEVAHLFPSQGDWSETEFLTLPTPHSFELVDGRLEAVPIPTWIDVLIGKVILRHLWNYLDANPLGEAGPTPLFVRLWPRHIRQPDIVYCSRERMGDKSKTQDGADLVVEIVSPGPENRDRDLILKRSLYAKAGIAEYWIVDPEERLITDLTLEGDSYKVAGEYRNGSTAISMLLPGFSVKVSEVFAVLED